MARIDGAVRQIVVSAPAMPSALPATLVAALGRARNRVLQGFVTRSMRRIVAAEAAGPAALTATVAALTARYNRFDAPVLARVDAEALAIAAPQTLLPAPGRADWFGPRDGTPHGLVIYVHGGSFVAERSPRITGLVARFAAAAGARVYAPAYRLAPEYPCPAGVEDIVAAWAWCARALPHEPVVALAESAGASVLIAALQIARDRGLPLPAGIVLLSPWVDLTLTSWSVLAASLAGTTPYTMESLAICAKFYLNGMDPRDPRASPLFGSFARFPPKLVHSSRSDILHDDALALVERLRDANGDLTVRLWADETHVWERNGGARARQSIELAAAFIRQHIEAATQRDAA